jgi:hypothetical protein
MATRKQRRPLRSIVARSLQHLWNNSQDSSAECMLSDPGRQYQSDFDNWRSSVSHPSNTVGTSLRTQRGRAATKWEMAARRHKSCKKEFQFQLRLRRLRERRRRSTTEPRLANAVSAAWVEVARRHPTPTGLHTGSLRVCGTPVGVRIPGFVARDPGWRGCAADPGLCWRTPSGFV